MSEQLSKHDNEVWQELVQREKEFFSASQAFLSGDVNRTALMRQELYGRNRNTAFYFLPYLKKEELMQLFDVLVPLVSTGHGYIGKVREAILTLPHDWVIQNIEQLAEPLLADGTDDEYRRFLELYYELDKSLTLKLARRASQHKNSDIREAGEDFIELLKDKI